MITLQGFMLIHAPAIKSSISAQVADTQSRVKSKGIAKISAPNMRVAGLSEARKGEMLEVGISSVRSLTLVTCMH